MGIRNPLHLPRIEHDDIPMLLRNLRDITKQVLDNNGRLDIALRNLFRERPMPDHMRALTAESGYALFRSWELLSIAMHTHHPDPAKVVGLWFLLSGGTLPALYTQEFTPPHLEQAVQEVQEHAEQYEALAFYPSWFNKRCIQEIGEELWHDIAMDQLSDPRVFLRTNTLLITRDALIEKLYDEGIKAIAIPANETGIEVSRTERIFKTKAFAMGLFEMQDIASQMIAPMLQAKSGMRIIDACAGEGGKALHIAALMENKGRLIAMDIHGYKLEELKRRTRRAHVWNIQTQEIQSSKDIKKLHGTADAVLIDAPCSGTGVLRRNPDTLLFRKEKYIDELIVIQQELLQSFHKTVKPGGCLVFCSCSILPSEGEKQIEQFLASEAGSLWTLEEAKRWCPAHDGFDGFYVARLRKQS